MTTPTAIRALFPVLVFVLAACTASGGTGPVATATMTPVIANTAAPLPEPPTPALPTSEPAGAPAATPVASPAPLSFDPITYRDERAGFALDYPSTWTLDPASQVGVRGGQALLLSPGTTVEALAEGGTRVSIVTYIWDPKNNLDAFVAQRKLAWDASGFAVTREEQWLLADGRPAYAFIVDTPDQATFTLITNVGEEYLQVSGEGDIALAEEIARTLRPLD